MTPMRLGILSLLTLAAFAQTPPDAAYKALQARQYDEAISWFLKAIDGAAETKGLRKDLAYTYLKTGERELARLAERRDETAIAAEHYEKAWQIAPERKSVLIDLGRAWKALGRTEDATAALLAAAWGGQPRAAENARELLPARFPYVYEFENALKLDPGNTGLRREFGFLLLRMKEEKR